MTSRNIVALCAFDVVGKSVVPVSDPWPAPHHAEDGFRWLHFDLNADGLHEWATEMLPEIAANALMQSETRPRCERIDDGFLVNLRGVNLNPEASLEDMVSLRMWVGPKVVVSACARKLFAVEAVATSFRAGVAPESAGALVAELVTELTKRIETVSVDLEEQVDAYEEAMIDGAVPTSAEIGRYRKMVIKLRRYVQPQRDALELLSHDGVGLLGKQTCRLIREDANRTRRSLEELDAARDRLISVQDHANAQQAQTLARNGHLLSIVASIFLPLGFLTGLFGVNLGGIPGASAASAFWILTATTVLIGALVFVVLKWWKLL